LGICLRSIEEKGTDSTIASHKKNEDLSIGKEEKTCQEVQLDEKSCSPRRYRQMKKQSPLRTWRTRKDPFESVWEELQAKLSFDPTQTAKSFMDDLMLSYPEVFHVRELSAYFGEREQ
jgi:hypothetical protein